MSKAIAPTPLDIFIESLVETDQVDTAQASILTLLENVKSGELELVLDQPRKSEQQKVLFLRKILDALPSPEVKTVLRAPLEQKDLEFFSTQSLQPYLRHLQQSLEALTFIKLKVAIEFKPEDIQEMRTVLSKRLGRPVVFEIEQDHTLIGGALIQYGNYLSDYSVRSRLQNFREQWHEAVVV